MQDSQRFGILRRVRIIDPPEGHATATCRKHAEEFVRKGVAIWENGWLRFLKPIPDRNAPAVIEHAFTPEERRNAKPLFRPIKCKPRLTKGVYLLRSSSGLIKIGCTRNLASRLSYFACIIPEDVEIFAFIPHREYAILERRLHLKHKDKRVKGEWFELQESDLIEITQLYHSVWVNRSVKEFLEDIFVDETDQTA